MFSVHATQCVDGGDISVVLCGVSSDFQLWLNIEHITSLILASSHLLIDGSLLVVKFLKNK